MSILKQKNGKIVDLRKPVEIKTYLTVSVLGKSLNLNINYKKIKVPTYADKEYLFSAYLKMGNIFEANKYAQSLLNENYNFKKLKYFIKKTNRQYIYLFQFYSLYYFL